MTQRKENELVHRITVHLDYEKEAARKSMEVQEINALQAVIQE